MELKSIRAITPFAAAGLDPNINYSHVLTISSNNSPFGKVLITVKDILPTWIEETHDEDDSDIDGDTIHTLGFVYLIDGIAQAYDQINNSENLYQTTFTLNY